MAADRHSSEPAFLRGSTAGESAPVLLAKLPRRTLAAALLVRWTLAALLGYLGAMTVASPVLAKLVEPLVANSPALDWLYAYLSAEGAARAVGAVQLAAALLLLFSPLAPWLAVCGSLLALGIFVVTLSFLFTTPEMFVALQGFPLPAPSATATFVLKDAFLLFAAAWSLIVALRVLRVRRNVKRATPASDVSGIDA